MSVTNVNGDNEEKKVKLIHYLFHLSIVKFNNTALKTTVEAVAYRYSIYMPWAVPHGLKVFPPKAWQRATRLSCFYLFSSS